MLVFPELKIILALPESLLKLKDAGFDFDFLKMFGFISKASGLLRRMPTLI